MPRSQLAVYLGGLRAALSSGVGGVVGLPTTHSLNPVSALGTQSSG